MAVNSAGTNYGGDQTVRHARVAAAGHHAGGQSILLVGQRLLYYQQRDAATPPVTFSLGAPAPAGATITTNGVFSWTPDCAKAARRNVITVWATDSGSPPLSNSMTFESWSANASNWASAPRCLQVGQSSSIPVNLFSTVGITNLSFSLAVPPNRFTNYTITPATAPLPAPPCRRRSSPPLFTLVAQAGPDLAKSVPAGNHRVHRAARRTRPLCRWRRQTSSAFNASGGEVGNVTSLPGQITVIGLHPLLASDPAGNGMITLTLYGNPVTNYHLGHTTNLALTNWEVGQSVLLSNMQQNISMPMTNAHMFFRLQ